jgi:hypothetical protein
MPKAEGEALLYCTASLGTGHLILHVRHCVTLTTRDAATETNGIVPKR